MLTFENPSRRSIIIYDDDSINCGELYKTDDEGWKAKTEYHCSSAELRQIADKLDELNKEAK